MLIDGNSVAYRAFFALPPLTNSSGLHTNAIFGFTTMLLKLLEEHKPTHVLVAFDAGKVTFRHEGYSEYKGGRQKTPPELSEQFPVLKELISSFGIAQFEPATARAVGLRDPSDPVEAVHAAALHLKDAAEWSAKRISGRSRCSFNI